MVRAETEQTLRENEQRLSAILEQLPVGTGLIDGNGRFVLGNSILRNYVLELMPSRDPARISRWRAFDAENHLIAPANWPGARALRGETVNPGIEFSFIDDQGRNVWMLVSAVPFKATEEESMRAVVVVQDISAQKKTEEALRESETLFRLAAGATNDIIWDWDVARRRVRWTEALKDVLGYSVDEVGTAEGWWKEKVHSDDREQILTSIDTALAAGRDRWSGEYRIRKANGSYAYVLDRGYCVRDAEGSMVRMIGAMQDVTERKELEETLVHANATLEQRVQERTAELEALTVSLRLLAAKLTQAEQSERRRLAELIHDDLQQLLVAAKIQVIALRPPSGQKDQSDAQSIAITLLDRSIEAARSLTLQLRPPALYESGLKASLGWLVDWMEQAHSFRVQLHLDDTAEQLAGQDAVLLFDSVRELLLNSVKHSGTNSAAVRLSRTNDDWLVVSVSDEGDGFDVTELDKMNVRGGGFGLFSIKERITAMGGRWEIQSKRGEGTTVSLLWPRTAEPPARKKTTGSIGALQSTHDLGGETTSLSVGQISVLLVDDHAIVRQSIADVMDRQPDISVVAEASDGEQAIDAVEIYQPQVVVMDVNLPEVNGIQACRITKERFPEVQVIGLSIHSDTATRQAMIDAGASAYLSKDGPVESLLATIRRLASPQV